jgi:hypothetical protein
MNRIKQQIKPASQRPRGDAPLEEKIIYLLDNFAYCPASDSVIELYEPSEACHRKLNAFRTEFATWFERSLGPRKGQHKETAVAHWMTDERRVTIVGIRMRPDMPFPLYEENGKWFKNTYRQPQHTGEGDVKPFLAFLRRLLPGSKEYEWFLDHMAYKQARPEIPGSAIIFVADNEDGVREGVFGTGRGLLARIATKLYGENYVRPEDFNVIAGTSSQGVFTDWRLNAVLVYVDEALTSPTAYRRGERKTLYDVLKNVVDPAPKRGSFKGKYEKAIQGTAYNSLWVFTNHANAVALPSNDRRITVLRNGRKMTLQERQTILAWMDKPGNIAALARFLETRELSGFDMFEPLDTDAKTNMYEMSRTPVEDVLSDLMEDNKRGLVFTRARLENAVEDILKGDAHNLPGPFWRGQLEGAWADYIMLMKSENGTPWRLRISNDADKNKDKRLKLYCFRTKYKQAVKLAEAARRTEALKWDGIDLHTRDEWRVLEGGRADKS